MPAMRVRFFATFRPIVGAVELDVPLADGATIDELVDWIAERYPEVGAKLRNPDGSPSRQAHVYVDGRSARWLAVLLRLGLPRVQARRHPAAVAG